VCDGVIVAVLVLALVVGELGGVLRGRGGRRPPVAGAVVVLAGAPRPVLVQVRPVRRRRARPTARPARVSVLRWREL